MQEYPVPQFIERESKLTFFLSFKQTLYLVGGGGICFVLYYSVPEGVFLIIALPIMAASVAFAFLKVQGQTLLQYILGNAGFVFGKKEYNWEKKEAAVSIKKSSAKKSKEEIEASSSLRMGKESQLKNKKINIEF